MGAGIGILISETVKVKPFSFLSHFKSDSNEPPWPLRILIFNSSISPSVRSRNADSGSDGVAGYNHEKIQNLQLLFKFLRGISNCLPWQGLATGTLLYVVFFEVIEKERLKGTTGMVQVMLLYWETTPSQEHNHAGHLCLAGLRLHARHGGGGTLFRGGAGPSNTLLRVRPSHLQQHLQASFNHMFARESHNITWVAM